MVRCGECRRGPGGSVDHQPEWHCWQLTPCDCFKLPVTVALALALALLPVGLGLGVKAQALNFKNFFSLKPSTS